MTWPDCGSNAAYARHYRNDEKPCAACRKGMTDYRREWRKRRLILRELAPCGTTAAYRRHLRHGENPCIACRAADREYRARQNGWEGGKRSPSVRGVRNGVPDTPGYRWRARRYPWAVRVLARSEARHGRPEDEEAA